MNIPTTIFVSPNNAFGPYQDAQAIKSATELVAPQQLFDSAINRAAALIFIDADHEQWRTSILSIKTSSATRRIPICLVSDKGDQRADATKYGAELALSWAEFHRQFQSIVADFARVPTPAEAEQLACECAEALPALAAAGVEMFNRGEYYRQHDLFEEQWVKTEGPVRDLYRAILQVGVAYYQIERGNYRGALKMLQRSVQWLVRLPDTCQDLDVAALRRDSFALRAALQRLGPEGLAALDHGLLKKLRRDEAQSPKT